MGSTGRWGSAVLSVPSAVVARRYEAPPAGRPDVQTAAPKLAWDGCLTSWGRSPTSSRRSSPNYSARSVDVSVPVDDADPTGAQVQLAVIKIPASGQRIGSLFVNPVAPGRRRSMPLSDWVRRWRESDHRAFRHRGVRSARRGVFDAGGACRTDAEFDAGVASRWWITAKPAWRRSRSSMSTMRRNA